MSRSVETQPGSLGRRDAVATLLRSRKSKTLVVTGLGSASYDVHSVGDRHDNYYLWGAMGAAALLGLGLAQARPDKHVLAITGDGEQLMGLGGLATIAVANPRNLDIVVIDNHHFGETGMQTSHTGLGIDIAKVAIACGFASTRTLRTIEEVQDAALTLDVPCDGPRLLVIKVTADSPPRSLPPRDAVLIKNRFRAHLGLRNC